jgi:hypothetical protein
VFASLKLSDGLLSDKQHLFVSVFDTAGVVGNDERHSGEREVTLVYVIPFPTTCSDNHGLHFLIVRKNDTINRMTGLCPHMNISRPSTRGDPLQTQLLHGVI